MNQLGYPQQNRPGQDGASSAGGRAALWLALLLPALTLAAFAAYAMFAPATYQATALISFEPSPGTSLALPEPAQAASRLRESVLDPEGAAQIAKEFGLGDSSAALSEAKLRASSALEVTPRSADSFEVHVSDPEAARAQRLCNVLARRAAARATQTLGGARPPEAASSEPTRQQRAKELESFLLAHPELAPPTVSPAASGRPAKDPEEAQLANLRAERDQLQLRIARAEKAAASADSDNPYAEPSPDADPKFMRRRLDEINGVLKRAADRKPAVPTKLSPELEREWKRLVANVEAAPQTPPAAVPASLFTVRLSEANLPDSPVDPDRKLVLLIGAGVSLALAVLLLFFASASARRRREAQALATEAFPQAPTTDPLGAAGGARRVPSDPPQRVPSEPPARAPSDPPRRVGSDPPARTGSEPAARVPSEPPPRIGSGTLPVRPPSDPPAPVLASPAIAASAPIEVVAEVQRPNEPAPLKPIPTQAIGAMGARHATLAGFAIVPAPIRTPLPPAPDREPASPEPAPVRVGAATLVSPSVSVSPTMPPPPPDPEPVRTDPVPAAIELSPNRTLTGPYTPATQAPQPDTEAEADAWRARKSPGRTTQMLGSPIPPVIRNSSRPPPDPARAAQRNSAVPAKPRPSGYSYVSTPPPQNVPVRNAQSQAPALGNSSGYLSTPAPLRGSKEPERLPRPAITTHRVHSGWTLDGALHPEARRQLSDQLFPMAVAGCFVVGVTGVPEARQQKSRVAVELAFALAEARHPRVLLVEGDFQWPSVHTLLHIEMPRSAGFSQQLRNRVPGAPEQWSVVECAPSLHVMAEGVMRSPGLILSSHFEDSLRSFRSYYDFVVIDGPLTSSEVDCRALDAVVDGVALVSPNSGSPWLASSVSLFPDKRFSQIVTVPG